MRIMDSDFKNSSNHEGSSHGRKYGLPGWMAHNIERLNTVTDFEQYACSPPETEGFLSEYMSGADCPELHSFKEPALGSLAEKPKLTHSISGDSKFSTSPHHLILDCIKHDDFASSPDSTPYATPEPSPAPRRKMSGQQDTVQTNPGRWFYLGNSKRVPSPGAKGQCFNVNGNKENRAKSIENNDSMDRQVKDPNAKTGNDGIRLVISNFDINAISPTSW